MFIFESLGWSASKPWISLLFLCTCLCTWGSIDCWSYHFSNHSMNWEQARAWCREKYTDMVAIQNQEEIAHLRKNIPKRDGYYWIGIRKINHVWTWVGTNKTLTAEATNWARGEPNNGRDGYREGQPEDCVEMYIKRDIEAGKWNDEGCLKKKGALCYSASCTNTSCVNGDCVETINNHTCACKPGFYGERCQHAVQCAEEKVVISDHGSVSCSHKYQNFSYESSCHYSCEEGYNLTTAGPQRCTHTGNWSEEPAKCKLVQCQELSSPSRGSINCFGPLGPFSHGSTCVFGCNEGYVLDNPSYETLRCGISGTWNSTQPNCAVVQCPALQDPVNGFISCGSDSDRRFSFGQSCGFRCDQGYQLKGVTEVTCSSAGEWSEKTPECEVVRCPLLEAPVKGHINYTNSRPFFNTQCFFTCDQDHTLDGHEVLTCSQHGNWTGAQPICQAVTAADRATAVTAGVTAGGAALASGLSLTMWILKRLRRRAFKFELNSNSDVDEPPQIYKSSIDSLI